MRCGVLFIGRGELLGLSIVKELRFVHMAIGFTTMYHEAKASMMATGGHSLTLWPKTFDDMV